VGDHFSFTTLFKYVGEEVAKCTGVKVRVVSTSLISSSPFPLRHWALWGPVSAERKVRGRPSSSRLSTGVAAEAGVGIGAVEGNHVGVNGTAGGRGSRW
jgi:hypothetical protein